MERNVAYYSPVHVDGRMRMLLIFLIDRNEENWSDERCRHHFTIRDPMYYETETNHNKKK